MIRILVLVLLAGAAVALGQRPAQAAVDYPWCLISAYGGQHCGYNSLDACLRDRVGGGGFCNPNPSYRGAAQPRQNYRTRRR